MENIDFISIYRKYRSCAVNIGRLVLGDEDEAEDVCQDTFETLFNMGKNVDFSNEERLKNLIVRISSENMNVRIRIRLWKYLICGRETETV